jgi:hypothetical protein
MSPPYALGVSAGPASGSRLWSAVFRFQYRILALIDPLVRSAWSLRGIGNVVELDVPRRNGRGMRTRMIGVLHVKGRSYVGHPNGDVGWTRDLAAARRGTVRYHNGVEWHFIATPLPIGEEREQVVRSTGQHPFPGNLVYRLGRRQVTAVGVYFRLDDTTSPLRRASSG